MRKPNSSHWAHAATAILVAYVALLLLATHWPNRVPGPANYNDKLAHFLAYSLLGFFVGWAWSTRRSWTLSGGILLLVGIGLFGFCDELTQELVPGRSGEVGDWCADLSGGFTGLLVFGLSLTVWRGLVDRLSKTSTEPEFELSER